MRQPKYKLSPNEVERLVKEERDRLRKLRIVQVREQAKANAALIRNQVRSEKERLLADFTNEVKHEVLAEKNEKIRKLEQKYDSTLKSIGQGHTEVIINGDGQNIAERLHRRIENEEKAMDRYNTAIEKHERDKAQQEWEDTRNIRNRNNALELESQRSAFIASLPPPPSDEIHFDDKPNQKKAIPMTDMKSFATTHYHIPDFQVVKAGPEEQLYDAKALAEETDLRLKQDLKEKKRSHHEQVEKARIRGNEALQKEILKHDLGDMLKDLSLLQRKDRRRRQVLLAEVPNQVFIPPERCLQERADRQLDMERKFEEMYSYKQPGSDPSTLQTWSELPTGDDTTNDSELSTLESVPLPPSEMALRDVTAASKKSDHSQKPGQADTVLKQLLNKIKEQRQNVLTNQKQGPGSSLTNQKSGKCGDGTSLVSNEDRVSCKSIPETPDEDWTLAGQCVIGNEDIWKVEDSDSKSSGSNFLLQNNALIAELQERIHKIEDQKMCLSQQLHSQSEFYQELQKQQQELQSLRMPSSQPSQQHHSPPSDPNEDEEATLEEISLIGRTDSQNDLSDIKQSQFMNAYDFDKRFLPPTDQSRVDLSEAVSKLRPVAGILKGTRNPQFELLASNGFLPAVESETVDPIDWRRAERKQDDDVRSENITAVGIGTGLGKDGEGRNILNFDYLSLVKEGGDHLSLVKEGGGARRMIDFGGRDLKRTDTSVDNSSGKSDKIMARDFSSIQRPDVCKSFGKQDIQEDPMSQKIKEYHTRAQELHASMDESTLNKVRDYQHHILQTHQERKQLLENIREDIERRRQALHTTSKYGGGGGAFVMNLAGGPPSMSSASSYPLMSSSVDSRPVISGSQSERVLEPIKPFIADPWLGSDPKKPSILKPSSHFEFQAQSDLSKFGLSQDLKPPSSVDKIRKSLAFDDLDSNVDASPAVYRAGDNLNDTTTSKHSQALTDDSKLTSSEEDRGSPILRGSRSDHWDTSDRSNNSVTGSSSLNGSTLVARAEERREGFERRQQELRNQLLDIQHQKEAILQRYYKGQQAIQEQQQVFRSKLLMADSSSSAGYSHQEASDARSLTGSETTDVLRSHAGNRHSIGTSESNPLESWSLKLSKFQGGNGTDKLSRRSSGGSLNLTGDIYLDEISYHQFKGTDETDRAVGSEPQPVMTSWGSLGQRRYASSVSKDDRMLMSSQSLEERSQTYPKIDWKSEDQASTKGGLGTWASVLSSNTSQAEALPPRNLSSPGDSSNSMYHNDDDDDYSSSSEGDAPVSASGLEPTTPSSQSDLNVLYHHQPHELSTIIEVDTPTATNSLAGSTLCLASASQSVQSLVSHTSAHSQPYHIPLESFDIQMDAFPDLPYLLPTVTTGSSATVSHPDDAGGQRAYNLATGEMLDLERGSREDGDGITLTEVSLGGTSTHSLESVPADIESGFDTTGGFNFSE